MSKQNRFRFHRRRRTRTGRSNMRALVGAAKHHNGALEDRLHYMNTLLATFRLTIENGHKFGKQV